MQKSLRKKLFLNLGGNRMLRNAAAIHYVCETEKCRSETAIGINHGIVVPLGIDLSPPSLTKERNISDQRPYLLVLSRLQPSKGIDVLIEAFLAAREDKPLSKWQLVIAGKGSSQYEALLKRKIKARACQAGRLKAQNTKHSPSPPTAERGEKVAKPDEGALRMEVHRVGIALRRRSGTNAGVPDAPQP